MGALLGLFWVLLGVSWGSLGRLWNALGGPDGPESLSKPILGSSGGLLVACWGRLWGFLEASCGSLGIIFGSCLLRSRFFALLRSSWGRFWSLQLTSQPSKIRFLLLSIHSANSTHSLEISRHILFLLLLRGLLLLPLPFESARRNARSD